MPIKILIADDHFLVREGLVKILSFEKDLEIVGEAGSGEQVIDLARRLKPDVILMDINMPGLNGLEATKIIKKELPSIGVIALTIHDDAEYVFELVRAGVSAYLLKDIRSEELVNTIRKVASGKAVIQSEVTGKLLQEFNRLSSQKNEGGFYNDLTNRELDILRLIAKGLSNKNIAERLYISEKTVKNHITNIFRKLGVEDRTQAALFAIKNKLVEI